MSPAEIALTRASVTTSRRPKSSTSSARPVTVSSCSSTRTSRPMVARGAPVLRRQGAAALVAPQRGVPAARMAHEPPGELPPADLAPGDAVQGGGSGGDGGQVRVVRVHRRPMGRPVHVDADPHDDPGGRHSLRQDSCDLALGAQQVVRPLQRQVDPGSLPAGLHGRERHRPCGQVQLFGLQGGLEQDRAEHRGPVGRLPSPREPPPALALALRRDGVALRHLRAVGQSGSREIGEIPVGRVDLLQPLGHGERDRDLVHRLSACDRLSPPPTEPVCAARG